MSLTSLHITKVIHSVNALFYNEVMKISETQLKIYGEHTKTVQILFTKRGITQG